MIWPSPWPLDPPGLSSPWSCAAVHRSALPSLLGEYAQGATLGLQVDRSGHTHGLHHKAVAARTWKAGCANTAENCGTPPFLDRKTTLTDTRVCEKSWRSHQLGVLARGDAALVRGTGLMFRLVQYGRQALERVELGCGGIRARLKLCGVSVSGAALSPSTARTAEKLLALGEPLR
jgi:hypothetical protein